MHNYRVVTIQERFIKQVIDSCTSVQDVMYNPLLLKFFMKLTESNEARRCLHYLFRVKCERIDTSFFTVKNLQKTYLRYKEINEEEESKKTGETPFARQSSAASDGTGVKTEREQAFYKEMFIQLLDIVDAITG